MNHDKQRIAIAEACGWKVKRRDITGYNVWEPDAEFPAQLTNNIENKLPNYLADLNAMHEAEATMNLTDKYQYGKAICKIMNIDTDGGLDVVDIYYAIHASAAQRAEAFLRTIGKWEGAK